MNLTTIATLWLDIISILSSVSHLQRSSIALLPGVYVAWHYHYRKLAYYIELTASIVAATMISLVADCLCQIDGSMDCSRRLSRR